MDVIFHALISQSVCKWVAKLLLLKCIDFFITAWTSNHMSSKVWEEMTCPFATLLKFGNGYLISFPTLEWM